VFVRLSSRTVTEEQLRQVLERFGEVEEAFILKAKGGVSKACAMVTFKARASGQAAIDEMHEKFTFDGADRTCSITWAEPPKPQIKEVE
jgi:RNA recognition motif-containing protein